MLERPGLATDEKILQRTGQVLTVGDLAAEYNFTDIDGRQPKAFRMPEMQSNT